MIPAAKITVGIIQSEQNRQEVLILLFLSQAFRLKEGQISPVFKSKFGYHIIKMESRAGDDAVVRHILLIPKVTDEEVKQSVQTLDSVRNKLVAGTLNFGAAVVKIQRR